ncbi:MAG: PQQ-binding-like beta-propeller repeat protein, partial [Candidatus Bathyarchaeota archaeon]|nr:PQQ-binding-like beta-propeller repeat protein [Candidatus Bathyarchaeota archaeon]
WEIVDLYTGDEISRNYTEVRPSFGQVYNYESPNQHGAFTYLWRTSGVNLPEVVTLSNATQFVNGSVVQLGNSYVVNRTSGKITTIGTSALSTPISTSNNFGTVWEMLDGYTEQTVCYIANVTQTEKRTGAPSAGVTTGATGTAVYGQDGSILRYNVVNLGSTASPQYFLQVWNTSAGTMPSSQLGTGLWQWRPAGGTFGGSPAYLGTLAYNYVHNGANFFSLNASIPSITGTANNIANQTASIQVVKEGEYVVLVAQGFNNGTSTVPGFILTLSLKPGEEGRQISRVEFTPPSTEGGTEAATRTGVYPEEGIIIFHKTKTLSRYGYSMDTGKLVWTSDPEVQFSYYGMYSNYYNGTLLSYGYGGVITCYDIKTGNVNWIYSADSIGTESAYGGTYPIGVVVIGDGKLYTVTGEHSPTQPLMRGPNLRCLDAATGEEVWKILGFFGGMSPTSSNIIMADGILVGLNYFDMQLYAFGRGPSAVTVDTPTVSTLGHKVMVTGTVTDQSPAGERDTNDVMDTPLKGTPAISDADMQAWMEYLFMEQVKPADAQGVTVTLNAIDPNGNYVSIGETTSDINGNWGCSFQPEVPGDYQIIANFAGSKAYGPSQSTTYLTVEDAPTATSAPTSPPESVADMYFVPAIAILAILIVVVGGVLGFLLLRKHP